MGLTFLNGAFLIAALAALVPIVIHLISRRRVETIDFSSLRFLKELERKRIRRVRLRQILLLIIRSLILLAVALALARPTLRGRFAGGAGAHAKTSVAIVLDESASMSRRIDGDDLFTQAVAVGERIADLLDEGDQAFLVTAGAPPVSVLADGTYSPDALREALGGLAVSAAATDYPEAIDSALGLLRGSRNLNREIYVVGDLQRTGWIGSAREDAGPRSDAAPAADPTGGATGGDDPADAASEPGDVPAVRGYLIPLTGPEGNLGVVGVEVARKHGGTAGLFSFSSEVRNWSRRSVEMPVKLFVDGVQVGQAGVELEPGAAGTARFAAAVDESKWHAGWIELPDDALPTDNRRYFTIPPARRVEILVVRPDGEDPRDDAYYLVRALDPAGDGMRFAPAVVEASALGSQERRRFPVAVLADVGRLDRAGERWIEEHVEDGGGLLIVLGSRTDMRYWNAELLPGLLGATLRGLVERPAGVRLAPSAVGHPLLSGLVVGERLIDDVSVRRAFDVEANLREDVLELPGLGPVLVLGRTDGGGEVAALLTGVDPTWSDLPQSGFLVPLVHRLVGRLEGGHARASRTLVGEDLFVPIEETARGRIDVELPGGGTAIAEARAVGRRGAVLAGVREPGIYRFAIDAVPIALGAVNVDPRESDLAPVAAAEIEGLGGDVKLTVVSPDRPLEEEVLEARHGRELWRLFVYAALVLIALEMLLARSRLI